MEKLYIRFSAMQNPLAEKRKKRDKIRKQGISGTTNY